MSGVTHNPLEGLSNEELLMRLKTKQESKRWTVGEIREVERRGYDFLSEDPVLQKELKDIIDQFVKNIEIAVGPTISKISEAGSAFISAAETLRQFKTTPSGFSRAYEDLAKVSKFASEFAKKTYEPTAYLGLQKNLDSYRALGESLRNTAFDARSLNFIGVTGPAGPGPLELVASDPKAIQAVASPLADQINSDAQSDIANAILETERNTRATSDRLKFGIERAIILIAVCIAAITGLILVFRR